MARSHVVTQGQCLQTIARKYGFADPAQIWNDSANDKLREIRPSMHVLAPGDVVAIPDIRGKQVGVAADACHIFQVKLPTRDVHIVLHDADDKPISGSAYVLKVGAVERRGKTNSDGAVIEKGFRPDIDQGVLELPDLGLVRPIRIGHLDPHHTDSGWRQRLANLDYPPTPEGLAQFLQDRGLPGDTAQATARDALATHSKS